MTPEEFIATLETVVFDQAASIEGLRPAGRNPHQVLVDLSDWYDSLTAEDQRKVRHAMRIAAYSAMFGMFVVLDGSAEIDDPPHGTLRLTYTDPDGSETQLNRPEIEELHGLWTTEVFPFTEDPADL